MRLTPTRAMSSSGRTTASRRMSNATPRVSLDYADAIPVDATIDVSGSNSPLGTEIDPPCVPAFPFLLERQEELGWLSWLADVKIERHGKRRLLVSIAFYLICGWVNIVFCNIADYRRQELPRRGLPLNAQLPDFGHDLIPLSKIPFLPDYFICALTVATLAMVLRHKHRLGILRRFFYVHGTLLLFRSLTIIATTLPDPQTRCGIDRQWKGFFASTNPFFSDTCGDLIFSGHTVVLTLQGMIWTDYGPKSKIVRSLAWLIAFGGILSLLSVRYHYTIDIIVAYHIAKRGWRWYGHLLRDRHLRRKDPIMSYLERRTSDSDFDDVMRIFREKRELVGDTVANVKHTIKSSGIVFQNRNKGYEEPLHELSMHELTANDSDDSLSLPQH